jgi:hypothetical protein
MHGFHYEGPGRRSEYSRRSEILQHSNLDDGMALHNALSSAVDDGQVRHTPKRTNHVIWCTRLLTFTGPSQKSY